MPYHSYTIVFIPIGAVDKTFLTVGASNAKAAIEQIKQVVDIKEICSIRSEN